MCFRSTSRAYVRHYALHSGNKFSIFAHWCAPVTNIMHFHAASHTQFLINIFIINACHHHLNFVHRWLFPCDDDKHFYPTLYLCTFMSYEYELCVCDARACMLCSSHRRAKNSIFIHGKCCELCERPWPLANPHYSYSMSHTDLF